MTRAARTESRRRDKPIIFSAPMVRALLEGRKTQTRRVFKPQPEMRDGEDCCINGYSGPVDYLMRSVAPRFWCRFAVGDRLWVREAWSHSGTGVWTIAAARMVGRGGIIYRSDADALGAGYWPSIHMPREFSRLTLTVTDVRVQRLQEISEEDAWQEGVDRRSRKVRQFWLFGADQAARERIYKQAAVWEYEDLWNSLHGPDAWSANPWVVAVTFTVEHRNIDALREAT